MDKSTHAVRLEQWTKLVQSCADSGLTKVNGKTNAPGKKTAAMAAANDFI